VEDGGDTKNLFSKMLDVLNILCFLHGLVARERRANGFGVVCEVAASTRLSWSMKQRGREVVIFQATFLR